MKSTLIAALAATALTATALPAIATATDTPKPGTSPSPGEIIAAAPATDWADIAPSDLLVMTLAPASTGKPRRVVIQLMPPPFSQGWIGNIRQLAAAHWYDGTSINRVQDNYVAQWGDANADDKAKAKPLPGGLVTVPQSDYTIDRKDFFSQAEARRLATGKDSSWTRSTSLIDPYALVGGFWSGWPVAWDNSMWPVHCYGMVGVARNLSPDTGTGAELYTVIGHAPRHLDRNIALVGRVIEGIEWLSSLPRGTGALGFYETAAERVPIISVRLGSDLPPADQPHFQYLSTESTSFARYADARANRRDAFFIRPAGGADICNVPVPVRAVRSGTSAK